MNARWQAFFSFLTALRAHVDLELLVTVTSLFTDKAGNIPFLNSETEQDPEGYPGHRRFSLQRR